MAKKKPKSTETKQQPGNGDLVKQASRAFALRGRATAEVVRLNDAETVAFAKLVTLIEGTLMPSDNAFGRKFDALYSQHLERLKAPTPEQHTSGLKPDEN